MKRSFYWLRFALFDVIEERFKLPVFIAMFVHGVFRYAKSPC
jgi:hypothetical protein